MAGWFEPPGGAATSIGDKNRIPIEQDGISRTITPLLLNQKIIDSVLATIGPSVVVYPTEFPLTEQITTMLLDSMAYATTYTGQNALRDLYRALCDDFHSQVNIRLIGDSITWGMTVSGGASTSPRTAQLSDTRNNLTSLCWANILRGYLGVRYAAGSVIAGAPGVGSYERTVIVPFDDARFVMSLADGTELEKVTGFNQYHVVGTQLQLLYSAVSPAGIEFDFYGDELTVVYAQVAGYDSYKLFVDSVQIGGTYDTAGDTTFNVTRTHAMPSLGWHRIRIENAQLINGNIVIVAVRWTKIIRVANDGIIGVHSLHWLPGTALLDNAVQADDEFVFCMIGTNDRGATNVGPYSPVRTMVNVKTTADHLRDTHGKKVILMCAGDVTESESGKKFTMAELSRAYRGAVYDMGYDLIDHYTTTDILTARGIVWLCDGLHPNDIGHAIMASTIIRAIEGAR